MGYVSGDYYVLCDRCQNKVLRSTTVTDVVGGEYRGKEVLLVCKKHYDGYHPQTKEQPVIKDNRKIHPSVHRPELSVDQLTIRCPWNGPWNGIHAKWEDIDCKWEELGTGNDVEL